MGNEEREAIVILVLVVLGVVALIAVIIYGVHGLERRHLRAKNINHREARRIEREYGAGSEADPNRKH